MPQSKFQTASNDCTDDSCADVGCREERSDCPPPLAWNEVLREFRDGSRGWRVERPNYSLCGRTWGTGEPLYFLNGMGGTQELFALIVWLLRDAFRCVLFDYPEVQHDGRTSRPTLEELADDLEAIADAEGDERLSLFSTSFGGLVALTALLRRPQRIERVVLQGGFAYRRLSTIERLLIRCCAWWPGRVGRLPLRRLVHEHNHRRWFPPFDEGRWQFFVDDTGGRQVAAQAWRAQLIAAADLRLRLQQISRPVLLLESEGDGLVSAACQRELKAGLPDVRTAWLANAGHLPYLTHPHRTARLVREFLHSGGTGSSPVLSAGHCPDFMKEGDR